MIAYFCTVCLEALLCGAIYLNPGRKRLACFRALVTFLFAKDAFLFSLYASGASSAYFYAYYLLAILEAVLTICTVAEVYRELFFPTVILPGDIAERICIFVTGITFAFLITGVIFPTQYPSLLLAAARTTERTFTGIECGALFVAFGFANHLGIPWRKRLLGVAAGLLFQASVATIVLANHPSHFNSQLIVLSGLMMMGSWFYVHLQPEPILIRLQTSDICELRKGNASITASYKNVRREA